MWISLFKTEGYIAKLPSYIVPIFRWKILHVVHIPPDKKQQYSIIGNNSRYQSELLQTFYQGVFMLWHF
ncbi:hypothetical protein ACX06_04220 [Vibrio parahaemolyticus]|nr:hypothetical protein [Vibrio parahaemolyticus]EGQ9863946.1 hypothetical protein [Vibrio parahaemolyticus]EGR2702912.1 hypothetical protein [Vibrio parahaemolyticus]EGR2717384.1 hypothetical protein [Vibrio parahaemolyticus]EGR3074802.1 hypothetical protein [Vibrio parahaemolyticus]